MPRLVICGERRGRCMQRRRLRKELPKLTSIFRNSGASQLPSRGASRLPFPAGKGFFPGSARTERGGGCLYIRHPSDVDLGVLEQLIRGAVAEKKRLYR